MSQCLPSPPNSSFYMLYIFKVGFLPLILYFIWVYQWGVIGQLPTQQDTFIYFIKQKKGLVFFFSWNLSWLKNTFFSLCKIRPRFKTNIFQFRTPRKYVIQTDRQPGCQPQLSLCSPSWCCCYSFINPPARVKRHWLMFSVSASC